MTKNSVENLSEKKNSIDLRLNEINKRILKNEFIPSLAELAQLSLGDLKNAKIWMLIGFAYTRMGIWSHAISALETAIKLKPGFTNAEHLLSLALFSMGKRKEACELADKVVLKESTSPNWMLRAYIHSHSNSDPEKTLKVAKDWGSRFADPLTRKSKKIDTKARGLSKKIKIGYVTADFREHSVAFFMKPILENHNKDKFEISVYSNGPEDGITKLFKGLVDNWVDIMEVSDEECCKKIRRDEIDILVDLSGFTHGHRLGVFARRAAPIQVTWLGYMLPLGMKAMDYRLADEFIIPEKHQKYYSENILYLKSMAAYAPPSYSPMQLTPPIIKNEFPTLISLNSSAKITDEMLLVWSNILSLRQDARLIIMVKESSADAAQEDMLPRVKAANMPLDRVSVLHQQPLKHFMELGYIADIALDTAPISGGTTTLHSLWMGLPVVTLDGGRGVDSSTAATIRALNWGGRISNSLDEYISNALDLMNDPDYLVNFRANARDIIKSSHLMDYSGITKDLESCFEEVCNNLASKI